MFDLPCERSFQICTKSAAGRHGAGAALALPSRGLTPNSPQKSWRQPPHSIWTPPKREFLSSSLWFTNYCINNRTVNSLSIGKNVRHCAIYGYTSIAFTSIVMMHFVPMQNMMEFSNNKQPIRYTACSLYTT